MGLAGLGLGRVRRVRVRIRVRVRFLWFGLGGKCPGGEMSRGMSDTRCSSADCFQRE